MNAPYSPPANPPIYVTNPTSPPTPQPSHLFSFPLLLLLPPTLLVLHAIRKDYLAFLALGPGGTPSTPTGYLRICILRLVALRDPFSPPVVPESVSPRTGFFDVSSVSLPEETETETPSSPAPPTTEPTTIDTKEEPTSHSLLPYRLGPRPQVTGIAPQRQLTQRSPSHIYHLLTQNIHELVRAHPGRYYAGTSCFEKHSTGIFVCSSPSHTSTPSSPSPPSPSSSSPWHPRKSKGRSRRTCNGEVCHTHPIDGSLHLTLHPSDVQVLLERGWGQRHPLAWEETATRWFGGARIVPAGFVMVYAPRDEREVQVVMEVVRAAGWWVSGED